jgi:uncharacterized protein YceH (UPF0502 family)
MSAIAQLSALEARILAVLVEKQRTVPDTYPLSLNALVSGCNQKSSRDPVMEVTDTEALEALEARVAELQAQIDAMREGAS